MEYFNDKTGDWPLTAAEALMRENGNGHQYRRVKFTLEDAEKYWDRYYNEPGFADAVRARADEWWARNGLPSQ